MINQLHIAQIGNREYVITKHYTDFAEAVTTIITNATTRYNEVKLYTLELSDDLSEEQLGDILAVYEDIKVLRAHYEEVKLTAHPIVLSAIGSQLEKLVNSQHDLIQLRKGA